MKTNACHSSSAMLLLVAAIGLAACGSAQDGREAVADWSQTTNDKLPMSVGDFQLSELKHHENQVIASLVATDSESFKGLSETVAFERITEAVCGLPGIELVWASDHEFYSSVRSRSPDTVLTVRTKSFDCCVVDAMTTQSRQDAQNACPYDD